MSSFPPFSDFYRAANRGRMPFPWQERLSEAVRDEGWPSEIGIPTGLGKTACIDIAVWALAADAAANGRSRTAPTRTWYVVNRRLLVDAAWEHGRHLADLLRDAANDENLGTLDTPARDAVAAVAAALQTAGAMGTEWGPLHITRLRGGADLGARVPDPSQPALIFATVPMFASRWLFRGYGSSRSMRPIDAALAGIDSLVLLDEAHLARPLRDLARPLAECDPGDPAVVVPAPRSRPVLVSMTATGESSKSRFDLDDNDRAHPVIQQRLTASKPVTLRASTARGLARSMADEAVDLLRGAGRPASCVIFANSPRTAREVFDRLKSRRRDLGDSAELVLLTGLQRDREADVNRGRILDETRGAPAGRTGPRKSHLIVVATQTLEVGADLDFDHIVTETAGVRALIQRFGRFNRLGMAESPAGVLCHPEDGKESSLYGKEPKIIWETLRAAAADSVVDMATGKVATLLGTPADEPNRVGVLLPNHVWEWVKTSFPPASEAPVDLFFQGFDEDRSVSVVWRSYIPDTGQRIFPPIGGWESVDVHIAEARKIIESGPSFPLVRLGPDRATVETFEPTDLRPGDVLLFPTQAGMYDVDGWNPDSQDPVLDVVPFRSRTIVLSPSTIYNLVPDASSDVVELVSALAREDADFDDGELLTQLADELADANHHPWIQAAEWSDFLATVRSGDVRRPTDGPAYITSVRRRSTAARVRVDAFDELSVAPSSATLHDHLAAVGAGSRQIAWALGCPDDLCRAVQVAGELHDLGKADIRFQRWLAPDVPPTDLLAKSGVSPERWPEARVASGWPRGGRHEVLSARLGSQLLAGHEHEDLIIHLVASHHGFGRPLITPVSDPFPTRVSVEVQGLTLVASGDLSEVDWGQPSRFRSACEQFGYWGVALLEAIVRQADHAASQLVEVI